MKIEKKVIARLEKCYALAKLKKGGQDCLLAAAEKNAPCYLFDGTGRLLETVWETDGGVMTMEQVPGTDGIFLSTRRFFSPNDSGAAQIVIVEKKDGAWKRRVLCNLPFVHRFGILFQGGFHYLIACTLKSAHAFKNDWTCPGRVWIAPLPEDLSHYDEEHPLTLAPLLSGLFKNHGFCKVSEGDCTYALIGTENGIYKISPPKNPGGEWIHECLTPDPASDMLHLDFDGDGERELLVFTPFHGNRLLIYKKQDGVYKQIYEHPKELPFLHAIWGFSLQGKAVAAVGNREGDRELLLFYYDREKGYTTTIIDSGAGPANIMHFKRDGKDFLLAANRETDETAIYTLEP
ncbi:MAG: hypothetical protein HFI63_02455 [Lachnospiraceae bacterium]|nr:hypothetical protein [Lachnospiraceae bacterium]